MFAEDGADQRGVWSRKDGDDEVRHETRRERSDEREATRREREQQRGLNFTL